MSSCRATNAKAPRMEPRPLIILTLLFSGCAFEPPGSAHRATEDTDEWAIVTMTLSTEESMHGDLPQRCWDLAEHKLTLAVVQDKDFGKYCHKKGAIACFQNEGPIIIFEAGPASASGSWDQKNLTLPHEIGHFISWCRTGDADGHHSNRAIFWHGFPEPDGSLEQVASVNVFDMGLVK